MALVTWRIWKFPFTFAPIVNVPMPHMAKVIHIAMQGDNPCIWAEVNPEAPISTRTFACVFTGFDVPTGKYLGTLHDYSLVWHIYDPYDRSEEDK